MDNDDFEDLKKEIEKINNKPTLNKQQNSQKTSNQFSNIAIEFITIPLVATYLGYLIDKYFSLSPIFLLICLLIGIMSSIINGIIKLKKYK